MQEFRVLEYLTLLHVVSLGVAEASFEILSNGVEGSIFPNFESGLDILESYGPLDLQVVVWILSPRGKTHKLE